MANLREIEAKLQNDPSFIGDLMVNPKDALTAAGLMLTNAGESRRLEKLVLTMQKQLVVAGELSAFMPNAQAEWGIGMGCCNSACLQKYNESGECS